MDAFPTTYSLAKNGHRKRRADIAHLNPSRRMTPISAAHSRIAHITFLMKCLASASRRKPWADVEAANAWNELSFASPFSSGLHDFCCCFWNKAMMNSLTLFMFGVRIELHILILMISYNFCIKCALGMKLYNCIPLYLIPSSDSVYKLREPSFLANANTKII